MRLVFVTVFFAIALLCIALARRDPDPSNQIGYGIGGFAAIFMSAHNLLALTRGF